MIDVDSFGRGSDGDIRIFTFGTRKRYVLHCSGSGNIKIMNRILVHK